jgi:Mrp family chromosome partitioning ATPase
VVTVLVVSAMPSSAASATAVMLAASPMCKQY